MYAEYFKLSSLHKKRPWPKERDSQYLEQWLRKTVEGFCRRSTREIHFTLQLFATNRTDIGTGLDNLLLVAYGKE